MIYMKTHNNTQSKKVSDTLRGDIFEEKVCVLTRKRELSRISFHACMENKLFSHFFLFISVNRKYYECLNDDEQE